MRSIIILSFLTCLSALSLLIYVLPAPVYAVQIVPSGSIWSQISCTGADCTYCNFVQLIGVVAQYLIFLGVAIAAFAFAWAGFLYMTAAGNTGQIGRANGIFVDVVYGIIFMLIAWLVINLFLTMLVSGSFKDTLSNSLDIRGTRSWNVGTCQPVQYQDIGPTNGGGTTGPTGPGGTPNYNSPPSLPGGPTSPPAGNGNTIPPPPAPTGPSSCPPGSTNCNV